MSNTPDFPISSGRDTVGRFLPGTGGRQPGSKNKISSAAMTAIRNMSSEAVMALRVRIQAGDMAAIAFCLDRVLPRGRLVELDSTDPLAVADSLAAGEITTSEAKDLATALAKLRDIAELDDLRARIGELEQAVGK